MSSPQSRFSVRQAICSRRFAAAFAVATLLLPCAPLLHAQASASSMPLDTGFGPLQEVQPPIPVAQIIQEFTAKESLFKAALDNYTWTRAVRVQTMDEDGHTNGQYYQVVDINYSSDGKREERVTDAPEGKLLDTAGTGEIMMSERDFSDIEERLPFVLTTEDAGLYDVTYLGQEKVDDIDTWVFEVKPKAIQKNKRYFEGRIWVDQKQHQIVVTDGKNVPDDLRPNHMDLTLPFITYRQMVDGKYWFPVYTVGQAVLHFKAGSGYISDNADMREVVKYSNYHQFRTDIRVIFNGQDITHNGDASTQKPQQNPPAQQPSGTPQSKPQP